MKSHLYVAYFDCLGFECILDLTQRDKKAMWSALKGNNSYNTADISAMIMRAKFNPQRSPEIWTFHSEIDIDELRLYSNEMPQELADLIRQHGSPVYVSAKQKAIIK